jgi:hypothetical protein
VQLQRRRGRSYVDFGSRRTTNGAGYFTAGVPRGAYRFRAYADAAGGSLLGTSRTATPSR